MRFLKNSELGRPQLDQFKQLKKMPVTVVLDNIRSGSNVGAVFRTADAFAVQEILLCGITACPPDREILKTALGATESVKWRHFSSTQDALKELKESSYRTLAIEQADTSIYLNEFNFDFENERLALVFGNEVKGVDDALIPLLDGCLEIPQFGTKHSLNVSVCAGVVLWELFSQYK
jgi:tRNA G18 (ribose-2'-O)-methylase SpoU